MSNKWSTFNQTPPLVSCIEVDRGYVNNGILSLTNNGGILVSKLFSAAYSQVNYVDRSYVAAYIDVYGNYTPPGGINLWVTENSDFVVTENGDNIIL